MKLKDMRTKMLAANVVAAAGGAGGVGLGLVATVASFLGLSLTDH
jgi:hypothetical protein